MTIRRSGDQAVKIVVHNESARVCAGVPSTMTGSGGLVGTDLVVPLPVLTCDDGRTPDPQDDGPPLEERLRNMTFVHQSNGDTLTDNLHLVWERDRGQDPSPGLPGDPWPQSSLDEVRQAQELADAGDPRVTWQVDPELAAHTNGTDDVGWHPDESELFARFLREELGWTDEFRWSGLGYAGTVYVDDEIYTVDFIRCAPGGTKAPDPNAPDGGCAPSIDEFGYEAVQIRAIQPADLGRGSYGVWLVIGADTIPTVMAPPSHAEAAELLGTYLQARIDGGGAEKFLGEAEVPLVYTTSSGAPYERYSITGRMQGPVWPLEPVEYKVRLFADGGDTVVEQIFSLERDPTGRVLLGYSPEALGPDGLVPGTTENDQPAAEPYDFLDGEVTVFARPPWRDASCCFGPWLLRRDDPEAGFSLIADPLPVETGCRKGPAPADARGLARTIRSDPDLEASAPVAVTVGGTKALRMDVTAAPGATICDWWGAPLAVTQAGVEQAYASVALGAGDRMRLYLLDLPEGLSARTLAIAIVAPKADFERVVEEAQPIVESVEFHTG
jgi:hypothetical protein